MFLEHGNGTSTWNHILRASLEVLADARNSHTGLKRNEVFVFLANCLESSSQKTAQLPQPQLEDAHQPTPKQANIFVPKRAHKLPFEFARSSENSQDSSSATASSPAVSTAGLWLRLTEIMTSAQVL